jgi:hypothetical protein
VNRSTSLPAEDWESELDRLLPLFGHRNWIVIADSAYPAQSNPGIETIATGADQLKMLGRVLHGVSGCGHIRAHVYTDKELKLVADQDAPGVEQYRLELDRLLAGHERRELAHEQIIAKLDQAGVLFRVLILKTTLRIPYTSVFLELDCGYWDAGAETRLRARMANADLEPARASRGRTT